MIVERTNSQIVIKISPKVDAFGFQRIMDYLKYLEITSKSQAIQEDADSRGLKELLFIIYPYSCVR